MARHKMVDGVRVPLTAEEESARDAEEAAWAAGAFDRAIARLRHCLLYTSPSPRD